MFDNITKKIQWKKCSLFGKKVLAVTTGHSHAKKRKKLDANFTKSKTHNGP